MKAIHSGKEIIRTGYPYLAVFKDQADPFVVLFTSDNVGTVVLPSIKKGFPIGHTSTTWDHSTFMSLPDHHEIILSND